MVPPAAIASPSTARTASTKAAGNEIDLLLRSGHIPHPIEVKSGQTLNTGFFKAFRHFTAVFGESPLRSRGTLVYGGTRDETREGVRVCGLAALGDALAELDGVSRPGA